MSRKDARDNAFKCVYEYEFNKEKSIEEILNSCYEENEVNDSEKEYIDEVVKGVAQNIEKIDENILKHLKNWSISRIAKIDLAILRVAIYEICYMSNVIPFKVSINEAVELAKKYGNPDSKSFVNGLLAKVIEDKK